MLPRADLNPTRPPASLEAATTAVSSTDARLEVIKRLGQIAIGRELQATVESMLDDGTFLVKVDDAAARMALPVGTKVGDTLSMVFIGREPKPTFLMTQQQGSAPASLSTAARLVDHIVQAARQNGEPQAVPGNAPVLTDEPALDPRLLATLLTPVQLAATAGPKAAPVTPQQLAETLSARQLAAVLDPKQLASVLNPKELATALQNTISSSGLFYESHLHEWISGSRTPAELKQEPQAQLARTFSARETPVTPGTPQSEMARLAASVGAAGEGAERLLALIRQAQLPNSGNPATDADIVTAPQAALPEIEPEAARLISQQLNTLEHEAIRWQGQLWPGQPMEWEIQEEKPEGGSREGQQQEQTWTSTVRFQLPHLGDISATIRLVGNRVHVQVDTATSDTASTVRQYGGMLADALEAAGAPLDSLTVKRHE